MKLKLIIWATPPSNKTLNDKFKKALNTKFITKKKNFEFYNELKLFILGLKIFLISSYYEIIVNLKNGLIFKIIVFNKKLRIEESIKSHPNIFQIMLSVLKTKPVIKRKNNQLNSVLKEGEPLIIVSNHPYVPIDGFSIMSFIHKHRKDYSLVINSYKLLESLKHKYLNHFIPVVNTPTKLLKRNDSFAHKLNVRSLKKCINALNVGRCIVIFPAGEASKAKKWGDEITDPQWLNGVGMIIKHKVNRGEPLNILPIYVSGHMGNKKNSLAFLNAVIENPLKSGAALQKALFNAPKYITINIGDKLSIENFKGKTAEIITKELREKVYCINKENLIAESK